MCDVRTPLILSKMGPGYGLSIKPNIAQPPPGCKRLLRLRNEGSSKFADVYYASPTGAKLRSLPVVIRYLESHPEQAHGIELGWFSFQIPRPLGAELCEKTSNSDARTQDTCYGWIRILRLLFYIVTFACNIMANV